MKTCGGFLLETSYCRPSEHRYGIEAEVDALFARRKIGQEKFSH